MLLKKSCEKCDNFRDGKSHCVARMNPAEGCEDFTFKEMPNFFLLKDDKDFIELFILVFNNELLVFNNELCDTDVFVTKPYIEEIPKKKLYAAYMNAYNEEMHEEVLNEYYGDFDDEKAKAFILKELGPKPEEYPVVAFVKNTLEYGGPNGVNGMMIFKMESLKEM
jgi:hypothetical protein